MFLGMYSVDRLEEVLCGNGGPLVLRTLSQLGMGEAPDEECRTSVLPVLAELGLGRQTDTSFELGDLGHKCADAAREYGFWTARQRRLHGESSLPALMLGNFEGKRVLEIGPGWGCNLFRLQQVTPHARGREIDEVYVRFTSIFAKMEGVTPPMIDVGGGEQLPYADGSFDWILMFSALQYMDVKVAAHEVARVLAPGGRLLTAQPTLSVLAKDLSTSIGKPRTFAHKAMTLLNSISYGLLGRRLRDNVASRATSRPVYLTAHQIVSIVEDAGLRFLPELSAQQHRDYLVVAEKPRASSAH